MMTGNLGKPRAGVNPLRGQNNVQGACDMGALPERLPGLPAGHRSQGAGEVREGLGPQASDKVGMAISDVLRGIEEGKVRFLYVMGENPMRSDPDVNHVAPLPGARGLPRGAGHLPHRVRRPGRRGAARRRPGPRRTGPLPTPSAGCSGSARRWSPGATPGPTGRSCGTSSRAMGYPADTARPEEIFNEMRTRRALLRRHDLRAAGEAGRHPLALPHRGAPGHADPARGQVQPGPRQVLRHRVAPAGGAARRRSTRWC